MTRPANNSQLSWNLTKITFSIFDIFQIKENKLKKLCSQKQILQRKLCYLKKVFQNVKPKHYFWPYINFWQKVPDFLQNYPLFPGCDIQKSQPWHPKTTTLASQSHNCIYNKIYFSLERKELYTRHIIIIKMFERLWTKVLYLFSIKVQPSKWVTLSNYPGIHTPLSPI